MLFLIAILFPIIAGTVVSVVKMPDGHTRNRLYAAVTILTDVLAVCALLYGKPVTLFKLAEGVTISFSPDPIGKYILAVVLILYTAVVFYAFEYMEHEERQNVFFAFLLISFGALMAVCVSGNLVTLYLSFESLTLTTFPLVLHEMDRAAVAAGLKYLFYSVGGALLGLFAVFFVYSYASGDASFTYGGFLDSAKVAGHEGILLAAVFAGIVGFGTKAGMYPMHGWLPTAHPIAPAPASALLSAIIAKAGVVCVIRLVYFSVGAEFIRGTWVQTAWIILALLTIFMGSMMAFREKMLKKRLAYSSVSQISYIMLGLAMLSDEGLRGGLIHLMSHAASKGTLFMVAGIFIVKLGIRDVGLLKGVGRRMPVTMWCFMIASLSLVGIPPMGGFLSRWVISQAALSSGTGIFAYLAPAVLIISALLTAGYLFPVAVDAFFPGNDYEGPTDNCEPSALMTVPMICLCAVALIAGLFGMQLTSLIG